MTAASPTSAPSLVPASGRRWGWATSVIVTAIVLLSLLGLAVEPLETWQRFGSSPAYTWHYWRPLAFCLATGGLAQLVAAVIGVGLVLPTFARAEGQATAAAVFGLCGLGAATALTLLGPMTSMSGALHATIGVLAAQVPIKRRQHLDFLPDMVVAVVLLIFILFSGAPDWPGTIGAIVGGLAAGVVVAHSEHTRNRRWLGFAVLAGICLVVITATWLV